MIGKELTYTHSDSLPIHLMRTSYLCITIKKQEASISIVQLLLTKKRNMKNLVLEEFDLHEFNKWMLDIQKL